MHLEDKLKREKNMNSESLSPHRNQIYGLLKKEKNKKKKSDFERRTRTKTRTITRRRARRRRRRRRTELQKDGNFEVLLPSTKKEEDVIEEEEDYPHLQTRVPQGMQAMAQTE